MPASRISADSGDSVNEIGSSIATVVTGPMPGQHADHGAEQHADEAVGDVLQRERDRKSDREIGEAHPSRRYRLGQMLSGRPSA